MGLARRVIQPVPRFAKTTGAVTRIGSSKTKRLRLCRRSFWASSATGWVLQTAVLSAFSPVPRWRRRKRENKENSPAKAGEFLIGTVQKETPFRGRCPHPPPFTKTLLKGSAYSSETDGCPARSDGRLCLLSLRPTLWRRTGFRLRRNDGLCHRVRLAQMAGCVRSDFTPSEPYARKDPPSPRMYPLIELDSPHPAEAGRS